MNPDWYHWFNQPYEDHDQFCLSSNITLHKDDQDYLDELLPWVFDEVEYNLPNDFIHTLVGENKEYGLEANTSPARKEKGARPLVVIPNSEHLMANTMLELNEKLQPYDVELYWPTLICTFGEGVCPHLHTDGSGLETRLNFYGYQNSPGSVLWFSDPLPQDRIGKRLHLEPDIIEKYPYWKYMREGGDDWSRVPDPIYTATTTNLTSAWVNPNCIHTVGNSGGVRITPSLKVRNIDPNNKFSHVGTWKKVLEFINGN